MLCDISNAIHLIYDRRPLEGDTQGIPRAGFKVPQFDINLSAMIFKSEENPIKSDVCKKSTGARHF